mmetsp:Transcript_116051/g.363048  ORF Transcript_116051/g.363048 Transcript_116051/m.363048 type:complete len:244 (-) Transcript_116051:311-1042(-)
MCPVGGLRAWPWTGSNSGAAISVFMAAKGCSPLRRLSSERRPGGRCPAFHSWPSRQPQGRTEARELRAPAGPSRKVSPDHSRGGGARAPWSRPALGIALARRRGPWLPRQSYCLASQEPSSMSGSSASVGRRPGSARCQSSVDLWPARSCLGHASCAPWSPRMQGERFVSLAVRATSLSTASPKLSPTKRPSPLPRASSTGGRSITSLRGCSECSEGRKSSKAKRHSRKPLEAIRAMPLRLKQ